jgi:hypothetical protein
MQQKHSIRKISWVGESKDFKTWAVKFKRYNLSDDIIFIQADDAIDAYNKAVKRLENEV